MSFSQRKKILDRVNKMWWKPRMERGTQRSQDETGTARLRAFTLTQCRNLLDIINILAFLIFKAL